MLFSASDESPGCVCGALHIYTHWVCRPGIHWSRRLSVQSICHHLCLESQSRVFILGFVFVSLGCVYRNKLLYLVKTTVFAVDGLEVILINNNNNNNAAVIQFCNNVLYVPVVFQFFLLLLVFFFFFLNASKPHFTDYHSEFQVHSAQII